VSIVPQESFTPVYPSTTTSRVVPDERGCGDFFDQDDAQKYYIAQGGPRVDPQHLDNNHNGQACELYPYTQGRIPSPITDTEVNAK
jgi:hypothetical protein